MSNIIADRVQETTTTTGTGTVTLAGAVAQFQSFANGIGNGNTCDYCILSGNGLDWETGNGTVTVGGTNTLSRTTIYASSNSGSAISLTGTSTVFGTIAANRFNAWSPLGPALGATRPTITSTGLSTWLNQGGATFTNNAVGVTLFGPNNSVNDIWRVRYGAVPGSTPYSFTAYIAWQANWNNYDKCAIGWTDGTKLHTFGPACSTTLVYQVNHWSNTTTFIATDATSVMSSAAVSNGAFYQIRDDGTTVYFKYSLDGVNFITFFSIAKSSGYLGSGGYTNYMFGVDAYRDDTYATIMSWTQGT